eukprot:TRINITY_DN5819_c0_g1_i2.p1 TRINITY_DN5819_c0_g1~~TRINITY_DN5819_c0_g1_i2.p1  ORF type:complete len:178 (-),score=22.64 TRINITY_DN5819_c0_g1_i2:20-553(-)
MIIFAVVLATLYIPLSISIAIKKNPIVFIVFQAIMLIVMVVIVIANLVIGTRLIRLLRSSVHSQKGLTLSQAFQIKITKYMGTFSVSVLLVLIVIGVYTVIGSQPWPYLGCMITLRILESTVVGHFVYLLGRRPPSAQDQALEVHLDVSTPSGGCSSPSDDSGSLESPKPAPVIQTA